MYVKLFGTILTSSIWLESLPTKVLWITMLAMADEDGVVGASVGGLAKQAGITREECDAGLAVFLAPDPDSRSEEHDGRRIEKVPGGWRLLNHAAYREVRTARQRKESARQQRHRAKQRDSHGTGVTERDKRDMSQMSRDVPPIASASASAVAVAVEQEQSLPKKELVGREASDPLDAVCVEAGISLSVFEPADRAVIEGALRASRAPLARAVVLASALKEHGPVVVGRAFREFIASEQPWSTRLFGGFVRDAAKQVQVGENRERTKRETVHIDREGTEAERARREEAETDAMIADFERTHGEEYETLFLRAEREIPASFKGAFRAPAVRGILARLIRERKP